MICDMGSGLREFGIDAFRRCAAGHPRVYNFFMSHLHWDHIMGFPFFGPAFDPHARIVIHAGHPDAEEALRRQQEEISFPVPFDGLRAQFEFRTLHPGQTYEIAGVTVRLVPQYHSHVSFAYRFDKAGKSICFSTTRSIASTTWRMSRCSSLLPRGRSRHLRHDVLAGDSVTMKADWGHSSNVVAIDLCQGAGAKRIALFHHEPTYSDEDIERMHRESIRYEELNRGDRPPLEVICAYDGLEVEV